MRTDEWVYDRFSVVFTVHDTSACQFNIMCERKCIDGLHVVFGRCESGLMCVNKDGVAKTTLHWSELDFYGRCRRVKECQVIEDKTP